MLRKLRSYTTEFKNEAIKLVLQTNSLAQTAKDLGLPVSTLHGWVKESCISHPVLRSINH